MKKGIVLLVAWLLTMTLSAQEIQSFVDRQLEFAPKSRLIDIYKSCFQDYMGAEHLVKDKAAVKAYLEEELATTSLADMMAWTVEPCGIDSQYVRVSLRTVMENVVPAETLLDAFVRSANTTQRPSLESWKERWHTIISAIDEMSLQLPFYDEDKHFIDSILSVGKYAVSHSPQYREAYHPHYRIVERNIYQNEIKPLIQRAENSSFRSKRTQRKNRTY